MLQSFNSHENQTQNTSTLYINSVCLACLARLANVTVSITVDETETTKHENTMYV